MSRIALDTSAYSHFRANDGRVVELLDAAEIVYLPTIVLGELHAAHRRSARSRENEQILDQFLELPYVSVVDVTADVARRYGDLFAVLRTAGTPISLNDVWIAACTMSIGAELVTFDSDFKAIKGLALTLLRPGTSSRG